jgi:hypothetical protein
MKRGSFFVLGIFVGIGLALGVTFLRRARQPEPVRRQTKQESGVQRTDSDAQSNAAKADELMAKIERLQRWSQGKEPTLKREEVLTLLAEWSDADPQAALTFVTHVPRFPQRNEAFAVPLAVLCARDPKGVIDWIYQNLGDARSRSGIARSILDRIKDKAPLEGLALAEAPDIPVDPRLFGELMGVLARTQPQLALQHFGLMSQSGQKRAVVPLLTSWAQTNPDAALAWYRSQPDKGAVAAASLIESCVKKGPYQVESLIQRLGLNTAETDAVLNQLSSRSSLVDIQELSLVSVAERQHVVSQAAWRFQEDPDRIVRLLMKASLPPGQEADAVFEGWTNWADSDRKAALDWLQQQPDRSLADEIGRRLQQRELARDPAKALAALPTIADQEQRKRMATEALTRLAYDQPEVAIAWLSQNQTESVSAEAYSRIASRYLQRDDAAAMDWIAKLGAGETKDAALGAAADYWGGKEIDFATTSMAAIGDSQKRQACMFDLYSELTRKDAAGAEQWLEQQGLSAEVRQSWKALVKR